MARLEIEVTGDVAKLETALAKAKADLAKFKTQAEASSAGAARANAVAGNSYVTLGKRADGAFKALKSPAGALAGAVAISAVAEQALAATNAASNLNEQVSKAGVVFGGSAGEIMAWSKTTAGAFGISQAAAIEASSTYGLLFRNLGVAEGKAADLSSTLVELAGDMASFNNTSVEEAINAIRSGLTGEIEPLRKFGVFLSEARTKTEALAQTGKKSAESLTTQEKVLARYSLLLQDTAMTQGDAARTADSFANQQRQLAAKTQELQANLGNLLLPVMTDIVGLMNDGATAALGLGEALGKIGSVSLGPLGDVKNVLGEIADVATRIGPIGFVRNAADIAGLFGGGGIPGVAGNVPDPSGGLSGLIPTTGGGGGPRSIFETAKAPLLNLPMGFQNATLKAQNENNRGGYLSQLKANRKWFETMLQRAIDAGDTGAVNSLRSDLEGTQAAIQGVYAQMNAEADRVRAAAEAARDKAKAAAEARGRKLEDGILSLGDAISNAVDAAGSAIKGISDAMQKRADDMKSQALRKLDRRQSDLDTGRALEDAQKAYRTAVLINGKAGAVMALRDLEDARIARARYNVEGADVSGSLGGGVVINLNGAVIKANNPDELIKGVQKAAKRAPKVRGGFGGIYGIG